MASAMPSIVSAMRQAAGPLRLRRPLRPTPSGLFGASGPVALQRRFWWDADAKLKNYDKPAITSSKHIFIRAQVPVVLLKAVRG
ncbi:unnamed protein product, partial [Polarella glacialis]